MQLSDEHQLFDYVVYTAQDAVEMACLLGEAFSRRDPLAVAVGLTPSEFEALVRLFCPKAFARQYFDSIRRVGGRSDIGFSPSRCSSLESAGSRRLRTGARP